MWIIIITALSLAGVDTATISFPDEQTCLTVQQEIAAQFVIQRPCHKEVK